MNISFFKRKKNLLFKIFIEFLFITLFGNLFLEKLNIMILLGLIFIPISYISGRYNNFKLNNTKDILKFIGKTLISGIITINIILFLAILLSNFKIFNIAYAHIIKLYCLYLLISVLVQFILNITISRYFLRKTKTWLIFKDTNINMLTFGDDYKTIEGSNYKYIFIDKLEIDILENTKDIEGIIFNRHPNLSKELQRIILKRDIKLITFQEWYSKFLFTIPVHTIYKNEFDQIQFDSNMNDVQFRFKRTLDIFFSIFLLIITLPLILISSLLIYIEDKGPIIYSQKRTGFKGEVFLIYKLRTMKVNAEKDGAQWSSRNDPRVTNIGKLLRKTRLDELPQLICVVLGQMSLIGPRPERPELEEQLKKEIKLYDLRFKVLPGLSGWAQVNYPDGSSIDDTKQKLSYDLFYIKNYSLMLDFLIFLKTIKLVMWAKGSTPKK